MDPATLIGISAAFGAVLLSVFLEGSSPMSIILLPPMILVFGGTLGVGLAGGLTRDFIGSLKALKRAFTAKAPRPEQPVALMVELAEHARRNGLLALEERAQRVDDPFLRRGLELLVDGTEPDELHDILDIEVAAVRNAGRTDAKLYADMGGYAPTIGIVGTVIGLVHVLENLSEPEKLGHLIAGAFVATLWGVMSANLIWLPIASRLRRLTELEVRQMELTVAGIMAIQSGSNPRLVERRLRSFLPPGTVKEEQDGASAEEAA